MKIQNYLILLMSIICMMSIYSMNDMDEMNNMDEMNDMALQKNKELIKKVLWTEDYSTIIEFFATELKMSEDSKDTLTKMGLPSLDKYLIPGALSFERGEILQTGCIGNIYELKNYPSYIEKFIFREEVPDEYIQTEMEMGVYASYFSPKIFVNTIGIFGEEDRSILMEKCESDLRDYLNDQISTKDYASYTKAFRQILYDLVEFLPNMLTELDRLGIIHGDIKPENILICNGALKLGDWDTAEFISQCKKNGKHPRGSIGYESPLQKNGCLDLKLDKYAVGKTLLNVLSYCNPNSTQTAAQANFFPEPPSKLDCGNVKVKHFALYMRITKIIHSIDVNILPEDDGLRNVLRKLLSNYLVDWRTCE